MPYQEQRERHSERCIKGQAKAGPPVRYARVVDEEVMNEVKEAVSDGCSDHNPEICFEPKYREQQEEERDCAFDDEHAVGSAHGGKQYVVGSDDDQHGWVKGTVAGKDDPNEKASHERRQYQSDQVFHFVPFAGTAMVRRELAISRGLQRMGEEAAGNAFCSWAASVSG